MYLKVINSGQTPTVDYRTAKKDKQLDILEEQIKLLGYLPRVIENPKTEAEKLENASNIFMRDIGTGDVTLATVQRQRYENILNGVPTYYEYTAEKNLDALEKQIRLLGYLPREIKYPKTEAEKLENTSGCFMSIVNKDGRKLTTAQRQRYENVIKDVPTYYEYVTDRKLDALEAQIKQLGYQPRQIKNPKTEAEKLENTSGWFITYVNGGHIALTTIMQRQRYENMLKGVPEYLKYMTEKNLRKLESFILGHGHKPSKSVWASEEERHLVEIFHSFKAGCTTLTASQQERFDRIKDVPTYKEWCKLNDLPWR
ncbi:MAG: hypothetical protein LBK68_03015 [Candidatus Margulisbacteria bacterium]|jgi:hypothetical protein|nr:hypothetical protein [Candidatus Margulisiibacteriota bacterium]